MSKICPETGNIVLYIDCLECEDKVCQKIGHHIKAKGREYGHISSNNKKHKRKEMVRQKGTN